MKISTLSIFSLILFCISCKSVEKVFIQKSYNQVEVLIIENPKQYLGEELNSLINDLKQDYNKYTFDTMRHFMLEGLNLSFKDDVKINVLFNWKNSDFNYGGAIKTHNEWDFEALKKEKIRSITIFKEDKKIYSVGIKP